MSERPPLLLLGDHFDFPSYKWVFNALYLSQPIYDVFGHTVVFGLTQYGHRYFNGAYDCDHVCYGGTKTPQVDWSHPSTGKMLGNPAKWDQKRAERILWIKSALSDPGIRVYGDSTIPTRRRYLFVAQDTSAEKRETEYFCVIVEVLNVTTKAFITAYDITRERWEEYRKVTPLYYPVKPSGSKSDTTRKKGGGK